jgi:hypothetical protein
MSIFSRIAFHGVVAKRIPKHVGGITKKSFSLLLTNPTRVHYRAGASMIRISPQPRSSRLQHRVNNTSIQPLFTQTNEIYTLDASSIAAYGISSPATHPRAKVRLHRHHGAPSQRGSPQPDGHLPLRQRDRRHLPSMQIEPLSQSVPHISTQ